MYTNENSSAVFCLIFSICLDGRFGANTVFSTDIHCKRITAYNICTCHVKVAVHTNFNMLVK